MLYQSQISKDVQNDRAGQADPLAIFAKRGSPAQDLSHSPTPILLSFF